MVLLGIVRKLVAPGNTSPTVLIFLKSSPSWISGANFLLVANGADFVRCTKQAACFKACVAGCITVPVEFHPPQPLSLVHPCDAQNISNMIFIICLLLSLLKEI